MLNGVVVLDFSHYLPGPFASWRLAQLGAEVIKIEPPSGDRLRPFAGGKLFASYNTGKKSVALDLKTDGGREQARRLAARADVLIESFRPGVMARLGLGYNDICRINERIIYCSISGFGQQSDRSLLGSHDVNYMALSGVLAQLVDKSGRPVHPKVTFADFIGGMAAAERILAALFARERTGKGAHLDVSLVDGLTAMMAGHFAIEHGGGPKNGLMELAGEVVCYQLYETKDGRYMSLAALEPHFWRQFCEAVGRPEWIEAQWAPARPGEAVYDGLVALFREKTFSEWSAFAETVDACLAPVLETDEAKQLFADDRIRHLVRLQPDGVWAAAHGPDGQWGGGVSPQVNEHAYLLVGEE
ncbi:CoA transferase [Geobacillus thermodenitrificans]|uniref:CaiB/BaiF CoA transferase family protein n=1 Tax=Geobacillus thermodenitrificans TaxID=33940 RepID=UPI000C28AE13|nr:CaiB/BaiF CoA-transferase family protein [Geobacillus thermodenitrificans]PJW21099.1 CoA transferase [Geobacillus thermodenitrificans]